MEQIQLESFNIIGITVKTENGDYEKLLADIGGLWNRFISENVIDQIPNKVNNNVYCVYTEYEGDYTKPYLALLGCMVPNLNEVPEGLIGKNFKGSLYNKYIAKGDLLQGIIFEKWKHIWDSNIPRTYIADFEVYGEKAKNPQNAEVEIFIGVTSGV